MRSQKSRSRSKGNRNNNRNVGNVVNRVFDSSGPEGKVRGTPQQIIDKYNQLTRDAQLSNDRVAAENFQQHAEHYTRMLAEAMREQQERQERQQQNQQNQQNQPRRNDDAGGQDVQEQKKPQHEEIASEQPRSKPRPKPKSNNDVIDMDQDNESSGLVETPEERPAHPRRTRRKAPTADAGEASEQPKAPTPDAAE
jgi:hypothetical protein